MAFLNTNELKGLDDKELLDEVTELKKTIVTEPKDKLSLTSD